MELLWNLYVTVVLPIEKKSYFGHFNKEPMTEQEFKYKPQVLFVGKYSTGKTSMIRQLTESSSYHLKTGITPTTNKFVAVVHGDERTVSGDAAVRLPELPYRGLSHKFGANVLTAFEALKLPVGILQWISFVDTPGLVAHMNEGRGYDFYKVCFWLAERADLVLWLFDGSELDFPEEQETLMKELGPHSGKLRYVLNKLDADGRNEVKGHLGEKIRGVLGSRENPTFFTSSEIVREIHDLPGTSLTRKIDTLLARIRRLHTHFCIVAHIRSRLPWRQEEGRRRWLSEEGRLPQLLAEAQSIRGIPNGDLPNEAELMSSLRTFEGLHRLPKWDAHLAGRLQGVLEEEIPRLLDGHFEPESGWERCLKRRRTQ